MEKLQHLLNKYEFVRRPKPLKLDILNALPFQLPADYKFYLENYEPFEGFMSIEYYSFGRPMSF